MYMIFHHEEQWIMMVDKSVMVYCCCYGLDVKPLKAQQLLQADKLFVQ